jgi:formylglycine-generating enzyme required for sulfatase activity
MGCQDDLNDPWVCSSDDREEPQHEVRLSAYSMDVHEITQAEYAEFVDDGHVDREPTCDWSPADTPDRPVVCVSWDDVRTYCQWLDRDLPTEAQWEYAARGPMSDENDYATFPWGTDDIDCDRANYSGCSGDAADVETHPSGVSPFGLHDMSGNVWELCRDWFGSDYYDESPLDDPEGPIIASHRVLRGGSWIYSATDARTAYRGFHNPTSRSGSIGARCAGPGLP